MTDDRKITIRKPSIEDDDAFCPECLVEDGADAAPVDGGPTVPITADRFRSTEDFFPARISCYGWRCEQHDVILPAPASYLYGPDGTFPEGWLAPVIVDDRGETYNGAVPERELSVRERSIFVDDDDVVLEQDAAEYDRDEYGVAVDLSPANAERSCAECGGSADVYLLFGPEDGFFCAPHSPVG